MKDPIAIDRLIDWLNKTRSLNPSEKLSDLLKASFCVAGQDAQSVLSTDQLVDLACIDLIQQRRSGNDADVESLVAQFPSLLQDVHLLDLIDAELCVSKELNSGWNSQEQTDQYAARFPQLAGQIADLINLNANTPPVFVGQAKQESDSHSVPQSSQNDSSLEMSLSPQQYERQAETLTTGPIDTPDWFVGDQIVASGYGGGGVDHWLIRGRDAARRTAIAMKVIKLPATLGNEQADLILDACERAAKVQNPNWVSPSVAAIQKQHLAVIRAWEFGNHWQPIANISQAAGRLRQLALVAYALQAAHRVGAAHGCVHSGNVIVCHDGSIRLVDARSSCAGITHWAEQGFEADDSRWQNDTQQLIKLIVADVIDAPGKWSDGLQKKVQQIAEHAFAVNQSSDACGVIGDELIRRHDLLASSDDLLKSDSAFTRRLDRSWRKRLASWIGGE